MPRGDLELKVRSRQPIEEKERGRLEDGLTPLRRIVEDFPVAEVHLDVSDHARRKDLHVKLSLHLPKKTLFTGERGNQLYAAYERSVRKMVHKVQAYKAKMRGRPERHRRQLGTAHDVRPSAEPDLQALNEAVRQRDYLAFRREMEVYRDSVSERTSRLVNRFPAVVERLGSELALEEMVEETFVNAFEGFADRPQVRLGHWLEDLIEPSIQALLDHQEEEKKNLTYLDDVPEE